MNKKKSYKDALRESSFSETLNYIAPATNKEQRKWKPKIIWLNTPFSRCVKTDIGRLFSFNKKQIAYKIY